MLRHWSPDSRTSIGGRLRRQPRKWGRSACCTLACAWLRMCCTPICQLQCSRPSRETWVPHSRRRAFALGSPLEVHWLRLSSSEPRSVCACLAAASSPLSICSDFLFLPQKRIGNKVLRKAGTASSRRCAVHFVWHVNTSAGANSECVLLVFFLFIGEIR